MTKEKTLVEKFFWSESIQNSLKRILKRPKNENVKEKLDTCTSLKRYIWKISNRKFSHRKFSHGNSRKQKISRSEILAIGNSRKRKFSQMDFLAAEIFVHRKSRGRKFLRSNPLENGNSRVWIFSRQKCLY